MSQQKRITIAQAVNIAKDIAIAQRGSSVTVKDVADLVYDVYVELFKKEATKVYKATEPQAEVTDVDTFIKLFKEAPNPIEFRNNNRTLLASFSKEDRDKILTTIGE